MLMMMTSVLWWWCCSSLFLLVVYIQYFLCTVFLCCWFSGYAWPFARRLRSRPRHWHWNGAERIKRRKKEGKYWMLLLCLHVKYVLSSLYTHNLHVLFSASPFTVTAFLVVFYCVSMFNALKLPYTQVPFGIQCCSDKQLNKCSLSICECFSLV